MYAPSEEGRYKVYILDEAHMLTREAWNALLKILEEPPSRTIFLLTALLFVFIGMILSRYVKLMYVGGLNRVAGGLFGLIQGVLILSLLVFALTLRPLPLGLDAHFEVSNLAPPFIQLGEQVFDGSWQFLPEE